MVVVGRGGRKRGHEGETCSQIGGGGGVGRKRGHEGEACSQIGGGGGRGRKRGHEGETCSFAMVLYSGILLGKFVSLM